MKRIAIAVLVVVAMAAGRRLSGPARPRPPAPPATRRSRPARRFSPTGRRHPRPQHYDLRRPGGGQVPGVVGEVTAIDGERLTVKNPMDGTIR